MDAQMHDRADATRILEATKALASQIRDAADTIEAERCLSPAVVRAMQEAGVFRLAIPRVYGGLELDPLTQVRVVEELSSMDGSVGWCAMIGIAGGYASACLDPPVAQRLFGNSDAVLAGQVMPVGRAELVDGGYRVSGRWRFGSGF